MTEPAAPVPLVARAPERAGRRPEVREVTTYGVIYADPPWRYRNFSDAVHGAAASAYDTMSAEALVALAPAVQRWAAPDAVLAMWATWPLLPEAQALLTTWGFRYVTGCPWLKTVPSTGAIRTGIGFWWQSASELLLIGRRGRPRKARRPLLALTTGDAGDVLTDRVFCAPRGAHSAKPLGVAAWLEATLRGPYLELFARRARLGWTCYGRDLGTLITPGGVEACEPRNAAEPSDVRVGAQMEWWK